MIVDMVLRQLGRRKGRTALTILGVAIGILLVTSLSSFSEGIGTTVNTETSIMSSKVTITAKGIGFESLTMSEVDMSLIDELSDFPGVEEVAPIWIGNVPGAGQVEGVDLSVLDIVDMDVEPTEGRWPEDGADEVMLGISYAESTGLKVGDELDIRSKRYEIVGTLSKTDTLADAGFLTSPSPVQDILKRENPSVILLEPINADESEALAREVEATYDDIQALSAKDAAREAAKFTGQLSMMTFAIGSISALIAGIGIMNVMFMSVRERRKEIGAMKALGATTHEILMQVVVEAVAITLIGEAIGLLLSFGAVAALNSLSPLLSATITPGLVINVTVFATLLGVFSGLLPAREAARLQPAVVLRYE